MDIKDLAVLHMGSRIFKAADLLALAAPKDLPGNVQYALETPGADAAKSLGRALMSADGIERVGTSRRVALWRVRS